MDYNKIRNAISNMRCKKHNKTPQNIVQHNKGGNVEFEFTACCPEFKNEVSAKVKGLLAEQMKADAIDKIKKAFK